MESVLPKKSEALIQIQMLSNPEKNHLLNELKKSTDRFEETFKSLRIQNSTDLSIFSFVNLGLFVFVISSFIHNILLTSIVAFTTNYANFNYSLFLVSAGLHLLLILFTWSLNSIIDLKLKVINESVKSFQFLNSEWRENVGSDDLEKKEKLIEMFMWFQTFWATALLPILSFTVSESLYEIWIKFSWVLLLKDKIMRFFK